MQICRKRITQRTTGSSGKKRNGEVQRAVHVPGYLGSVRICCLPRGAEYTVGNKALLTLGLFPGQGSFWVCSYRQCSEREKNNLKARGKKKEPPKKTRDSIKKQQKAEKAGRFPPKLQKAL